MRPASSPMVASRRWWLPFSSKPVSFAGRALHRLPDLIAGLGTTRGFVVDYAPENAVAFDREGNPVRTLERAERLGSVGCGPRGAAVDLHSPAACLPVAPGDQSWRACSVRACSRNSARRDSGSSTSTALPNPSNHHRNSAAAGTVASTSTRPSSCSAVRWSADRRRGLALKQLLPGVPPNTATVGRTRPAPDGPISPRIPRLASRAMPLSRPARRALWPFGARPRSRPVSGNLADRFRAGDSSSKHRHRRRPSCGRVRGDA